jgi:hypothetical protein
MILDLIKMARKVPGRAIPNALRSFGAVFLVRNIVKRIQNLSLILGLYGSGYFPVPNANYKK